ncbi:MAG: hypothetical protein ROR55_20100 [Devosia sp.]
MGRDGGGGVPTANVNVGLILDKAEMAGATAADFIAEQTEGVPSTIFADWSDPSEPDGWAKTGTHNAQNFVEQSGGLRLVGDGATVGLRLPASLSAGAWYRYEIDVTITSGSVEVEQRSDAASLTTERTISATGTVEGFIYGAGTATSLGLSLSVASDVTVNSLSLKDVPGRHFVALSDALRPVLKDSSGLQYLEIATDAGMVTEGDETVDAGFFACAELRYPVYDGPSSPERVFGISNSVKSHRQYVSMRTTGSNRIQTDGRIGGGTIYNVNSGFTINSPGEIFTLSGGHDGSTTLFVRKNSESRFEDVYDLAGDSTAAPMYLAGSPMALCHFFGGAFFDKSLSDVDQLSVIDWATGLADV